MIPTAEALAHVLALMRPVSVESVGLRDAAGRVLAEDVAAHRDQPPFRASVMDGYAVRDSEVATGRTLTVIGEAAAGQAFAGTVAAGQAVRIFTGAPVPDGADRVIIQEDVTRTGDTITIGEDADTALYVRPSGADFKKGSTLSAPRRLSPSDLALLAAMNAPSVKVYRRPVVALIATGDELVMPGEMPNDDQIIASNTFGLAAMIEAAGGHARLLPIARDTEAALETVLGLAEGADLIVTIGGASVGDHDLVGKVAAGMGLDRSFYKIAMRPGKPLMAGRLGDTPMIGLPGNPVSAMVCGRIFLVPALQALTGRPADAAPRQSLPLAHAIGQNGPREHYMRARMEKGEVTVFERQDSALLSVLSTANCLAVRPPHDPPRDAGDMVEVVDLTPND